MPHLPDHVTHDPELIAAYAAGDADRARARRRRPTWSPRAPSAPSSTATCARSRPRCPSCPPRVRPRDFRLTPEQAASLRPAGWRGVLAAFAAPRFRLAAPLGTGLAAAGLAGLLLASPGGLLPRATGEAASGSAPSAAGAPAVQADQASGAAAHHVRRLRRRRGAGRARGTLAGRRVGSGSRGRPEGRGRRRHPAGAGGRRRGSQRRRVIGQPEFAAGLPAASPQRELAATTASGPPDATRAGDAANRAASIAPAPVEAQVEAPPASASTPWLVASGLLVLVGVALVVLRLASRRVG